MSGNSLSITDNRTGKQYEVPIENGTIKAMDLRQIKTGDEDFGLMTYDPAFMNTASCKSRITFIDGDKGILEYRGYPIDQLAELRIAVAAIVPFYCVSSAQSLGHKRMLHSDFLAKAPVSAGACADSRGATRAKRVFTLS